MATAACLPIAADRAGPCVRTIFFEGLDLTGIAMAMELRLNPETPGPAPIALDMGATANAEGIRLVGVTMAGGVPTSQVVIRINETTMKNAAQVPYSGELGSGSTLYYDLIGTFGQDKRRLVYGTLTAVPTVFGMDAAPASRAPGPSVSVDASGIWSNARLSFSDDQVRVVMDGADLMGAQILLAEQASEQAADLAAGLPLTYSSPNLWPDPALTASGWSGSVVTGISPEGRHTLTVTGSDAYYRLPVAIVGGAGAVFSVGMDVEQATFAGGTPTLILVRQLRADTTLIEPTLVTLFGEGDDVPTTKRVLARAGAMVAHSEAAIIEIYVLASGNAGNSITVSLLGLYRGASAAYRPVVAAVPGVPDIYVDAVPGPSIASDLNDGRSASTPFRTLAAAIAAVAGTPNRTIGLRRGSVFRGESIEPTAPGLTVIAYGEGAIPKVLGSDAYSAQRLTAAGSGVYTLSLAYKPTTCALVNLKTGEVVKLYNPDSNDVPPATGNWGWASNTLHITPGFDISGCALEVPKNSGPGFGFATAGPRQRSIGIEWSHWRVQGMRKRHADAHALGTWCNWNGFDGFDQDAGADRFLISGGGAIGNGRRPGQDSGPGDGSSAHDTANGVIEYATFKQNTQTGVGNLIDTRVVTRFCYFEDNEVDYQVYAHGGGSTGDHTAKHECYGNIFVHRKNKTVFAINGTSQPTGIVSIHHNTAWYAPGAAPFIAGYFQGMAVDLADNIISAPGATYGLACYVQSDGSTGKVTSRNNVISASGGPWQAGGYGPARGGGSETGLITTDPLFTDPDRGDFSLSAGSPAIGSGVAISGYARDYSGRAPANPPSRGALEYVA